MAEIRGPWLHNIDHASNVKFCSYCGKPAISVVDLIEEVGLLNKTRHRPHIRTNRSTAT